MKKKKTAAGFDNTGERYILRDIGLLASADAFLWNDLMYLQIDQRGRTTAQYNQPQHSFYSEPERAFYLRDDHTGEIWSVPYDPVCRRVSSFEYSVGRGDIRWNITYAKLLITLELVVPRNDTVELWRLTVNNRADVRRQLSVISYMPFGFMSWLNNETRFDQSLNGAICSFFPYYAKIEDYRRWRGKKNMTVCLADRTPLAFECGKEAFCGMSGLHRPHSLVDQTNLSNGNAMHESAIGALQFAFKLAPGSANRVTIAFGPVHDYDEARALSQKYLSTKGFDDARNAVYDHLGKYTPAITIDSPDPTFDAFFNTWLPNQILLGGQTTRMDFAPHTRNAIIDAMGLSWSDPHRARNLFLRLFSFQSKSGLMPMGVQIDPEEPLNAVRTCFHRDINVWGPLAFDIYITETGDDSILDEPVGFADSAETASLFNHVTRGLEWQLRDRTRRGLSRIGEGDWNDPLNMAGHKGRGESIWLTQALAASLKTWASVCQSRRQSREAARFRRQAALCLDAAEEFGWNGDWYARGITDDGRVFGTKHEKEGRIYLNTQAWAMIAGIHDRAHVDKMIRAVDKELQTPWGPHLLAPAYTRMQEDIGRICQKNPGYAENGSVYCHAVLFYVHGLFAAGRADEAFRNLRMLIPGPDEAAIKRANQLPLYVPSLYHGEPMEHRAGESNKYFRTGTCSWMYYVVANWLLGTQGTPQGLRIDPRPPKHWPAFQVQRRFRGALFDIHIRRESGTKKTQVTFKGEVIDSCVVPLQPPGSRHQVEVVIA